MQDATSLALLPTLTWAEQDVSLTAIWRSERGAKPPQRVQIADDTMSADTAYKLANEGVGLLWRGDFQNAKHLLQALERRLLKRAGKSTQQGRAKNTEKNTLANTVSDTAAAFYRHRQARAQRARVLGMVLLLMHADYAIPLRRAPDARLACEEAWGKANAIASPAPAPSVSAAPHSVVSLRELLGIISAHEWRKRGVAVPALGFTAQGLPERIHAHYGVFSPVRGGYLDLVRDVPLPTHLGKAEQLVAFDIGTGTGILTALLARRGVGRIVATDLDARALACAQDNFARLRFKEPQVSLLQTDLFPDSAQHGRAHLIVCNPPWLPGQPSSALERAVYDEGSRMLKGFLQGLPHHLAEGGHAWLILSDLAEHLGLRDQNALAQWVQQAGLKVVRHLHSSPQHPKAHDKSDPFFAARSQEITHLWCLAMA